MVFLHTWQSDGVEIFFPAIYEAYYGFALESLGLIREWEEKKKVWWLVSWRGAQVPCNTNTVGAVVLSPP